MMQKYFTLLLSTSMILLLMCTYILNAQQTMSQVTCNCNIPQKNFTIDECRLRSVSSSTNPSQSVSP